MANVKLTDTRVELDDTACEEVAVSGIEDGVGLIKCSGGGGMTGLEIRVGRRFDVVGWLTGCT